MTESVKTDFQAQPASKLTKRKQVKIACTNCAKTNKGCDNYRPCQRCVRYGVGDTCVDLKRKKRRTGVERGPYKRGIAKDASVVGAASHTTSQPPSASTTPASAGGSQYPVPTCQSISGYSFNAHDPSNLLVFDTAATCSESSLSAHTTSQPLSASTMPASAAGASLAQYLVPTSQGTPECPFNAHESRQLCAFNTATTCPSLSAQTTFQPQYHSVIPPELQQHPSPHPQVEMLFPLGGQTFASTLLLSLSCAPLLKQHLLRTLNMSNEVLTSLEPIIADAWEQWDYSRQMHYAEQHSDGCETCISNEYGGGQFHFCTS